VGEGQPGPHQGQKGQHAPSPSPEGLRAPPASQAQGRGHRRHGEQPVVMREGCPGCDESPDGEAAGGGSTARRLRRRPEGQDAGGQHRIHPGFLDVIEPERGKGHCKDREGRGRASPASSRQARDQGDGEKAESYGGPA
jgi:hypothetical protein